MLCAFKMGGFKTRRFIVLTLMELPLVYFHEFTHFIVSLLLFGSPTFEVVHILPIRYSNINKCHVTSSYDMTVTYNNCYDGVISSLVSLLISTSPTYVMLIFLSLLTSFNVYLGGILLLYLMIFRIPWNMSKQDTDCMSIDIMVIKMMVKKQ